MARKACNGFISLVKKQDASDVDPVIFFISVSRFMSLLSAILLPSTDLMFSECHL